MGGETHLFSFYPEENSGLKSHPRPSIPTYRRVQMARHLIDTGASNIGLMKFDAQGKLTDFGAEIKPHVRSGIPFMTSGCVGEDGVVACNRPFANERPSEEFRNFPFIPTDAELDLIEKEMTMKKIITQQSLENALMVNLAIGGSTNAALHLPAIAHELGLELSLSRFNDYNRIIPTLCGISPNGPHGMVDLFVAGGIPAVMKRLGDHLHRDPLTVSGMSIGDIIDHAEVKNPDVIPDKTLAFQPEGGTAVLFGNLAPEGAVVKQSAVADKMRVFTGPARVFDAEADALKAIREKTLKEGEVIVIRYEGPRGGPGMPETLAVTMGLDLAGFTHVALITDGRFSGATAGPCIGHVSPEAASGGPIAIVENGDIIRIDIPARKLDVDLKPETIQQRLANWKPVVKQIPSGYMQRYVNAVTSAAQGAVLK